MKYEKNVYRNLIKYFILVFVILSLFIMFLYYFVFMQADKDEAYDQFLTVDESLDKFLDGNDKFFNNNANKIEDFIEGKDKDFIEKAYEYKKNQKLNFSFLAFDKNYEFTNHFSIQNKINRENYKYIEILLKGFDHGKYYSYGNDSDNKKIIYIKEYSNGFLVMQIQANDLFKTLNRNSKNYILTNKYDRILSKGSNIKYDDPKLNLNNYKDSYISYKNLKEEFNLYVIKEKFFSKDLFLIIFMGLSLITLLYILVISIVTKKISKNLSHSLKNLIYQIGLVSEGKVKKISIDSDDEIKYISDNINTLIDSVKKLESNNTSLKYEKKASDVKALESQFNPHFLYNTLDIISYQMYMDKDSCQKLISNLSKILRYSINNMSFVYLEEDLEYIGLYIQIQKIKHNEMLEFNLSFDKNLKQIMVPKLFIQPILENSLKYGFAKRKNLTIDLDIYQINSKVYIDIKDTGEPLNLSEIEKLNRTIEEKSENSFLTDDHHGLENSLKRLKILYKDAKLEFIEDENVLVRISFRGQNESTDSRR